MFVISGKANHSLSFRCSPPFKTLGFLCFFSIVFLASPEIFNLPVLTQDLTNIPVSLSWRACLNSLCLQMLLSASQS